MKKTSSNNKPLFRNCPMSRHFETRFCSNCKYCEKYDECLRKKEYRKEKRRKLKIKRRVLALEWVATFSIVLAIVIKVFLPQLNINTKEAETVVETTAQKESTPEIIYVNNVDINISFENQPEVLQPENTKANEVINLSQINNTTTETKEIVPKISAYGPSPVYYYHISEEDKLCLKKVVYKESLGEPYKGKVSVAATALNRWKSGDKRFDTTSIKTVITQSYAFASIDDVTEEMVNSVPDIERAVEDALHGWDPTREKFENGALFFYAPALPMSDYQRSIREDIEVFTIGGHNFHIEFNEKVAGEA